MGDTCVCGGPACCPRLRERGPRVLSSSLLASGPAASPTQPSPPDPRDAKRYDAADHTLDTSYTWEVNVKGKRTYIDGRFTAGAKNPLPMVNGAKTKAQLEKVNVEVSERPTLCACLFACRP